MFEYIHRERAARVRMYLGTSWRRRRMSHG